MADEKKLFETILSGLMDWMWGKGKADIQRQIQQATPDTLATIIGHITYALVQQGYEQAHSHGHTPSMDVLFGVATELIESLEKMAAAMNMQFDAKAVSLQALTQALNDYAQSMPDGSHAQKEAQEALKSLGPKGMSEAGQTLHAIGAQHGINPFTQGQGQVPQGEQAPQGQQGPAGAAQPPGGQQGLMGANQ